MAKLFQITLPTGLTSVKLDSQGRATVQYTMKNVSARPIDGRAVLVSLPQTNPPSGPVENGWIKIDGKADRHFDVDKEETFNVKIAVPPKSPAGTYTFRMDGVWVQQTDSGDLGASLKFTVAETPPSKPFPLWIIPVIAVVLIAIGVGIFFAVRGGGPKVPDLTGQTLTDAEKTLTDAGFTVDSNVETVESDPKDSGKITSQDPGPGKKASKGQAVKLTLGAEMVDVPSLMGQKYQEALANLNDKHLTPGQTKNVQNANVLGGVVVNQTPPPQQKVKAGTAVDLEVTPETVTVPNVAGQTLGSAILNLKGLTVTSFSGDNTKTVSSQSPAPGTAVPLGSPVTLAFPPPASGCGISNCVFTGTYVKYAIATQYMRARDLEKRNLPPK